MERLGFLLEEEIENRNKEGEKKTVHWLYYDFLCMNKSINKCNVWLYHNLNFLFILFLLEAAVVIEITSE